MSRSGIRLLLTLVIVGLLTACGGQKSGEGAANTESPIPAVYKQRCLSCHGDQLEGRVGPNLQAVGSRLTEEEIAGIISDGKGGMPAFGKRLSEEELASISAWLAEQQ
ncbi:MULTISPECIES: c-type cytochrome [Paenibacillus]|uniref:c-type cytochrome n=1 Tax=Paenibacillus TaxID=44249 RepID=UPI0011A3F0AD|nr:cytochrome c [Paenibacillus sp. IHBB 10380]